MSGIDDPINDRLGTSEETALAKSLNAALGKSTADLAAANAAIEEAAKSPEFLRLLAPVYKFAKLAAPTVAGMAGGPAALAIVTAGVRLLDAADGPNL